MSALLRRSLRFTIAVGAAGAAALAGALAGGAGVDPAAATTPPRACVVSRDAVDVKRPLLTSTELDDRSGLVELHGSVRPQRYTGGDFTAVGCTAAGTPVGSATFTLLKAPKTRRYLVVVTTYTTIGADGKPHAVYADTRLFSTERAFTRAIKGTRTLTVPGLKGPVYAPPGHPPIDLLASKVRKHAISRTSRQLAAAAFLKAYGPYAPQAGR